MEELIKVIINNGVGVASYIVLIYFLFNYTTKINDALQDIIKTLIIMQNNQQSLADEIKELKKEQK